MKHVGLAEQIQTLHAQRTLIGEDDRNLPSLGSDIAKQLDGVFRGIGRDDSVVSRETSPRRFRDNRTNRQVTLQQDQRRFHHHPSSEERPGSPPSVLLLPPVAPR